MRLTTGGATIVIGSETSILTGENFAISLRPRFFSALVDRVGLFVTDSTLIPFLVVGTGAGAVEATDLTRLTKAAESAPVRFGGGDPLGEVGVELAFLAFEAFFLGEGEVGAEVFDCFVVALALALGAGDVGAEEALLVGVEERVAEVRLGDVDGGKSRLEIGFVISTFAVFLAALTSALVGFAAGVAALVALARVEARLATIEAREGVTSSTSSFSLLSSSSSFGVFLRVRSATAALPAPN